jgi:hypothetical protein
MSVDPTTLSAPAFPVERHAMDRGAVPGTDDSPIDMDAIGTAIFGDDGLTFDDLLDVINPLHHIPVVSTLYRHFTGDTIANGPRLAGGGLFGGLIGLAGAAFNIVIEESTGQDVGDHVLALLLDDDVAPGGNDKAPARPAIDYANLEPGERVAALAAYAPPARPAPEPAPILAGLEDDTAPERAAAIAAPAPAAPAAMPTAAAIAGLAMADLEPGERAALLMARPPAPPAAEASPRALAVARAPAPSATQTVVPVFARPVASAAGSQPGLSSDQWQALTSALEAYAAGSASSAPNLALLQAGRR